MNLVISKIEVTPGRIHDFAISGHGTIFVLWPQTDEAREWATEKMDQDGQRWSDGYVVEHRYIEDIINGFRSDGLTVIHTE